jgi:hypothetical protein
MALLFWMEDTKGPIRRGNWHADFEEGEELFRKCFLGAEDV